LLTDGCGSTLSHLWGQLPGLSRASWDAVNRFQSDTDVFLHCCEVSCASSLIRPNHMVPASLCLSHPYLVYLTSPGTKSTALGVTQLCLAFLLSFLCKYAYRMVPGSLCLLRAVPALFHTFGDRSHSSLVFPTALSSQSTAFCVTQLCLAFLQGFVCKEAIIIYNYYNYFITI
jgi:hypothetical protein